MQKYLFLFIIAFFTQPSSAQQKKVDSLLNITKTTDDVKKKVDALNKLCNLLMYDKPQEAKQYIVEAMALAEKADYKLGMGDAYNSIGVVYDISGKYDSSIYYYEKALPIFNSISNQKGRGSTMNNLGLIYWNQSNYDKALSCFLDALKDFEAIGNDKFMSNALNNIGLVYFDIGNYRKSLEYHVKAKAIYEKLDDAYLMGAASTNMANAYSELHLLDSAQYYYEQAIALHTRAKDDYGLSTAYNGYAGLLAEKGNDAGALDYFSKTLAIKESLNEKVGESSVLINMAGIYNRLRQPAKELEALNRAQAIAEEHNIKKDLIKIYEALSAFYEKTDLQRSLSYYKKYSAVKDSVFNENSSRQVAELSTRYETSKKELQLKQKNLQLSKKNIFIVAISGLLALTLLLGFSYYKRYRLSQEKKLRESVIAQQDAATRAVIVAEENERRRIAADLHDGVGQMMSAAKMNLSAFEDEARFADEKQKQAFEKIIGLVDESCKEIRNVSHQMMPNALLKSGLSSAIREFIDKIDSRVIRINLYAEGLSDRLDSNIETVLYRVIQECVNNVIKHAGASTLDISLIRDGDGISATIEDNGKGFDAANREQFAGIGLKNIISRIEFLKGMVDFDSTPGKGTLVAIHVPLKNDEL
jgi:signal transduction histidine kinase